MLTEEMISELYRVSANYKNRIVGTGEVNISMMCNEVAKRLQELNDKINDLETNK